VPLLIVAKKHNTHAPIRLFLALPSPQFISVASKFLFWDWCSAGTLSEPPMRSPGDDEAPSFPPGGRHGVQDSLRRGDADALLTSSAAFFGASAAGSGGWGAVDDVTGDNYPESWIDEAQEIDLADLAARQKGGNDGRRGRSNLEEVAELMRISGGDKASARGRYDLQSGDVGCSGGRRELKIDGSSMAVLLYDFRAQTLSPS